MIRKLLNFITGCGLTRTQTVIAQIMLAMALFMLLPLERPVVWVLEEWGGDGNGITIPHGVWSLIFGIAGFGILRERGKWLSVFMILSAALVATVMMAGIITQGLTANAVMLAPLVWHCIGSARDAREPGNDKGGAHGLGTY